MPNKPLEFDVTIEPPLDSFMPTAEMSASANRELVTTMKAATFLVRGNVITGTPHCFGFLRRSILPETIVDNTSITGRISTSLPYALPVETGSRPHWAPLGPLELWVKRKLAGKGSSLRAEAKKTAASVRKSGMKGITASHTLKGEIQNVARRIQYKIAHRGTKGHFMFKKGFEASKKTVFELFEAARDRIIEMWSKK